MKIFHMEIFLLQHPLILALVIILGIWSVVCEAIGLWTAARRNSKIWFVIFLLVHTLGILEIIYIYAVAKKSAGNLPAKQV